MRRNARSTNISGNSPRSFEQITLAPTKACSLSGDSESASASSASEQTVASSIAVMAQSARQARSAQPTVRKRFVGPFLGQLHAASAAKLSGPKSFNAASAAKLITVINFNSASAAKSMSVRTLHALHSALQERPTIALHARRAPLGLNRAHGPPLPRPQAVRARPSSLGQWPLARPAPSYPHVAAVGVPRRPKFYAGAPHHRLSSLADRNFS
jgi:hypothetical protein